MDWTWLMLSEGDGHCHQLVCPGQPAPPAAALWGGLLHVGQRHQLGGQPHAAGYVDGQGQMAVIMYQPSMAVKYCKW